MPFLFSFFFVKDQIASFQLKQIVVFWRDLEDLTEDLVFCVYFKLISLLDCDQVWLLNYNT